MLTNLPVLVCVFVSVTGILRNDNGKVITPKHSKELIEKLLGKNSTMLDMRATVPTIPYKYPTATWTAAGYEARRKHFLPETSKLYLFKPSPFLKPPFTEGDVGASISGIEDGVDVMGRRTGKPSRASSDRRIALEVLEEKRDQEAMADSSHNMKQLDQFLEHSLGKYLRSSNLSDIFGYISVETFSEALKRVLEENRSRMPPYDRNKEHRRRFRDEVLFPKKMEQHSLEHSGGLREKQYQKRLQKTWEVLKDNSLPQKMMVRRMGPSQIDSTTDRASTMRTESDNFYMGNLEEPMPTVTEQVSMAEYHMEQDGEGVMETLEHSRQKPPPEMWKEWSDNRELDRNVVTSVTGDWMTANERQTDEVKNSHEFVNEIYLTTEAAFTEPAKESNGEESKNNQVLVNLLYESTRGTTSTPVTHMPTKLYRGRTKYRDTVKHLLENSFENEGEVKLSVAETVYYRPRAAQQNTFNENTYNKVSNGAIPGQPGKDYPTYSSPPRGTGFRCPRLPESEHKMKPDKATRCQVFYICKGNAPPSPVLCPNGTVFNEDVSVCDWWFNVDC